MVLIAGSGHQENPLLEAVVAARSDLRALVMDAGFGVLGSLLEEDRAELCGERYARSEQRRAYRHGYDEGSLVMGGRRVKVRKPRGSERRWPGAAAAALGEVQGNRSARRARRRADPVRRHDAQVRALVRAARRRASFVGNESLECVAAVRSAYSQAGAAVPGPTAQ